MLCSASLLKRRARGALSDPKMQAGWGRCGDEGSSLLAGPGRELRQPLAGSSSWEWALKSQLWEENAPVARRIWGVSFSPCFLPGSCFWLALLQDGTSGCAQASWWGKTLYLLIVCYSPALKHQGDGNNTSPLSPWLEHGVAGALPHAEESGSLSTLQASALECTMRSGFPLQLLSPTVMGSER